MVQIVICVSCIMTRILQFEPYQARYVYNIYIYIYKHTHRVLLLVQLNSVQFKMVSMRPKKPIYAPPISQKFP